MRNKSQPVKMGVQPLEGEPGGEGYLPAASSSEPPELGAPSPGGGSGGGGGLLPSSNLVLPTRSPLTVDITNSLTADNHQRSLEHTSISSNNTSPELEDAESGDGEESALRCSHCEASYPHIDALRAHMEAAHPDKPNKNICDKCGAAFVLRTQLEKHLTFHSPTSQVCKVCQKTFANVYRLQRHMISHNESSDLRKFKCPTCAKAFKFKHHLKEHIRIHSGEKPFECSNCGKRFSHSGSYSSHMTSKKCWIVNSGAKARRPADAAALHKNANAAALSPDKAEDALRGVGATNAAKLGENGAAADMSSLNQLYVSQLQQVMHAGAMTFDPTGAHLGQQYMAAVAAAAHLNGNRPPFLPYPGAGAAGHLLPAPHPMMPGLPTSAYPMGVMLSPGKPQYATSVIKSQQPQQQQVSGNDSSKGPALSPSQSPQVPLTGSNSPPLPPSGAKSPGKTDENQNSRAVPDSHDTSSNDSSADEASRENSNKHEADKEPGKNLCAVQKILDRIKNHAEMQKNSNEDKAQISKLSSEDGTKGSTGAEEDATPEDGEGDGAMPCRHCKDVFHSPVELHQHERYLCRLNREIQHGNSGSGLDPAKLSSLPAGLPTAAATAAATLAAAKKLGTPTSAPVSEGESESDNAPRDDMFLDKDGHQYRVRSMLSDEQQKILKAHYARNPRPDKFAMMQIATEVSFPKRVVQVWFQNMRARDRRRGLPVPTHRAAADTNGAVPLKPGVASPAPPPPPPKPSPGGSAAYIPVVPHIPLAPGVTSPNPVSPNQGLTAFYANKANGQIVSPSVSPAAGNVAYMMQMEPLDLSTTKSSPAKPHKPSSDTVAEAEQRKRDQEVLNLSGKAAAAERAAALQGLEHSVIYKYMQREGMLPGSTPRLVAHPGALPPGAAPHRALDIAVSGAVFPTPVTSTPARGGGSPSLPPVSPVSGSHSDGGLASPPSSLDSSFNSTLSLDSAGFETGSLNGLFKSRRARKKSWRQLESEEGQSELADAIDSDGVVSDGGPSGAKKRRSWKAHRLDGGGAGGEGGEGLYACDQCEKMFAKQSSLARHKYEHSGQRPFPCDICSKSFKHKHHLTEHKRLHSGEKPFECKKCGKRFSHSGSYSQHMNHRYKYCKPLRLEAGQDLSDASAGAPSPAGSEEEESGSNPGDAPLSGPPVAMETATALVCH